MDAKQYYVLFLGIIFLIIIIVGNILKKRKSDGLKKYAKSKGYSYKAEVKKFPIGNYDFNIKKQIGFSTINLTYNNLLQGSIDGISFIIFEFTSQCPEAKNGSHRLSAY